MSASLIPESDLTVGESSRRILPSREGAGPHPPESVDLLLEMVSELAVVTTRSGTILRTNAAWSQTLGYAPGELNGTSVFALVHPEDAEHTTALAGSAAVAEFTNRYRHKDGTWRRLRWSGKRLGEHWCAVADDVTERLSLERRAMYDDLTQLGNRSQLVEHLAAAVARLGEGETELLALLFVDLDGFKLVNDGLGHEAGDQLLVEVARRLRQVVRGTDHVSRFGGDEFVVVSEGMAREADALALGERMVEAISREYAIAAGRCTLSCSIGISTTRFRGQKPENLLREADTAMYRAKTLGSGRVELFDQAIRREIAARLLVERGIREALREDRMILEYQPVVTLPTRTLAGCEALVRWDHPERGLVLPGEFIPVVEPTGLIVDLGARVLEMACEQAGRWRREGHDLTVSINVSRRQLLQPGFVEVLRSALKRGGVPGHMICLEVTETAAGRHARTVEVLRAARRLGIKIALDDFGAGYSTLANLRELPIDVIKIDRSFVSGVDGSGDDPQIVAAVMALARELGIAVVAEGVETEEQLAALGQMHCPMVQGFLLATPGPAEGLVTQSFGAPSHPGFGDPFVIREAMRQIGIPARLER